MSPNTKSIADQQSDSLPSAPEATDSRPAFIHVTTGTVPDFRIVFIDYLKGGPNPLFHLVNADEWQALKEKYGDDIPGQTSKIVECGDEKYAWLFKVSEVLGNLKIKNVRLITERDISEDSVFFECEPNVVASAKFMAKLKNNESQEEEAEVDEEIAFRDTRKKVIMIQRLWRGRAARRIYRAMRAEARIKQGARRTRRNKVA